MAVASSHAPLVRRLHRRALDGRRLTGDGEPLLRSLPTQRIVPVHADAERTVLGVVLLGFVADAGAILFTALHR